MQLSQYQHRSTPVPSTGYVCPAVWCRNMDPLGCRHEDTGGFSHEVSETYDIRCGLLFTLQRCFSDLVCQPLVPSCVIDAYLCLAMLHAWILEYQHMMLCVWWWIPTKADSQWPAGEDHRVALATSGSTRSRRITTPYRYNLRCGDLRSPMVMERRNGPLGLRDDDDDDDVATHLSWDL